jgi:hypothetical protein
MTGPPGWQPGTQYNYGDIVEFECKVLVKTSMNSPTLSNNRPF